MLFVQIDEFLPVFQEIRTCLTFQGTQAFVQRGFNWQISAKVLCSYSRAFTEAKKAPLLIINQKHGQYANITTLRRYIFLLHNLCTIVRYLIKRPALSKPTAIRLWHNYDCINVSLYSPRQYQSRLNITPVISLINRYFLAFAI